MTAALSSSTATTGALRRRSRQRRTSAPAAALRRVAASVGNPLFTARSATGNGSLLVSGLVEAVAARVLEELRPELRRLEEHIASVALAHAGRKPNA